MIDINTLLLVLLTILVVNLYLKSSKEHMVVGLDAEAVENIASIYSTGTMTVNNLTVTNGITIGNTTLNSSGIVTPQVKTGETTINSTGVIASGNISCNDLTTSSDKIVRTDGSYGVQSSRGGYLSDQGGWKSKPTNETMYEVLYFRKLPYRQLKNGSDGTN